MNCHHGSLSPFLLVLARGANSAIAAALPAAACCLSGDGVAGPSFRTDISAYFSQAWPRPAAPPPSLLYR